MRLLFSLLSLIVVTSPGFWEERTYPDTTFDGRAIYYSNRAENRFALRDYWGAIDDYSSAISYNSSAFNYYLGRARAHCMLEKYGDAARDLAAARELASLVRISFRTPGECQAATGHQ